ncbi:MAG: ABC transporter permease [Lachnospiraceae bacterium]|nr:ABC transporter permease [Lachnospiraceae bacterium]
MRKKLKKNKAARAALGILLFLILIALFGPMMTPYSYREQLTNEAGEYLSDMPPRIPFLKKLGIASGRATLKDRRVDGLSDTEKYPEGSVIRIKNRYTAPSGTEYCDVVVDYYVYKGVGEDVNFWFGTDQMGRDLWTRLWRGTRVSLLIALIAVTADLLIGTLYGAVCGYFGGKTDLILMRFAEIIRSIPNVVICSLFIMLFGTGIKTMILALAVRGWTQTAQLVRAQFLRNKTREYVLASRMMGASDGWLIFRHILPNSLSPLLTGAMMAVPSAIFTESFLAYIGLGIPAPEPSLGTLLSGAWPVLELYPLQTLLPALVISVLLIAFTLFTGGLRDVLDPSEI